MLGRIPLLKNLSGTSAEAAMNCLDPCYMLASFTAQAVSISEQDFFKLRHLFRNMLSPWESIAELVGYSV